MLIETGSDGGSPVSPAEGGRKRVKGVRVVRDWRMYAIGEKLARYGARPKMISSLTGMDIAAAKTLYKEVNGDSANPGMMPYDPTWVLHSSLNCVHGSIFLAAFAWLESGFTPKWSAGHVFLAAYDVYRDTAVRGRTTRAQRGDNVRVDINRGFHLTRQWRNDDLAMPYCAKCGASYLVIKDWPKDFTQCPVCDVWVDRAGRHRYRDAAGKGTGVQKNGRRKPVDDVVTFICHHQ